MSDPSAPEEAEVMNGGEVPSLLLDQHIIDDEAMQKIKNALAIAVAMLEPENQPPQYTVAEAMQKIDEAIQVLPNYTFREGN